MYIRLLGAVIQAWKPCFGILVDFLAVETTELETKVQIPYHTLQKSCTDSWISHIFVAVYEKPIEALLRLTAQGGIYAQVLRGLISKY